jgi:hypothetical protein
MNMRFTTGRQPCDNYIAQMDGNQHAVWENEHQCYKCGGDVTVSFYENCKRDHHQGGYETCVGQSKCEEKANE